MMNTTGNSSPFAVCSVITVIGTCSPRGKRLLFNGNPDGAPYRRFALNGNILKRTRRGLPNAARRRIDNTQNVDGVLRIERNRQVTDHVLDFRPLIETEAAGNP